MIRRTLHLANQLYKQFNVRSFGKNSCLHLDKREIHNKYHYRISSESPRALFRFSMLLGGRFFEAAHFSNFLLISISYVVSKS